MYHLPLFDEHHRDHAERLEVFASAHDWPDPEAGDDRAALLSALKSLADQHALAEAFSPDWSLRSNVISREILAYHSGIADLAYAMQALGGVPILLADAVAENAELLADAEQGKACLAFAITEPEAGSDLSRLSLRAEKDGEEYVLNGEKHLVSNVGSATHYTLFARTSDDERGISAFVVPADLSGFSCELQTPIAPHPLGKMNYKDARIPAKSLLGAEGDGMKLALGTLGRMRTTVAAAANGMAKRALDETIAFAKTRQMFGKTLAVQPIAQGIIAEMKARLDASRLLTYRAAYEFDNAQNRIPVQAGIAKWQSTENAQWIIDKALQLHGGRACIHGHSLERLYREIRPLRIYEGASEVQQIVIASELLK
ncbi:MAG: acyl-CoA dehydrogenase family protein [Planctomycetota bacterium]